MINSLRIKNWKAFEDKHITLDKGITFFVGPNGIGKTTLLEAICLAVTGISLTADFQELVRQPGLPAEVQLDLEVDGKKLSIRRRFRRDRKLLAEIICDSKRQVMSWDDLTYEVLNHLSVDKMFFNRLTYMSEGEVYNYLKDPPAEALNSRIQEIFGIANLKIVEEYTEMIRKDRASSIREISSELRTITSKKPIDESQIETLDNYISGLREKEKDLSEKIDIQYNVIREVEEEKKNYENLKQLLNEIVQAFRKIIPETAKSFDKALQDLIKHLEVKIESEEENLRKTQTLIGSIESKLANLNDIKRLLQSTVAGTAERPEVPCPVCRRPIDKILARRLISDIEKQTSKIEKELLRAQETSNDLQIEINNFRKTMRKATDYETKLHTFPATIMEKIKPMTFDKIDELLSFINASLRDKVDEVEKNTRSLESFKKEIYAKTQELANMRAEIRQTERLKLLKSRLRIALRRAHVSRNTY